MVDGCFPNRIAIFQGMGFCYKIIRAEYIAIVFKLLILGVDFGFEAGVSRSSSH